MKQIIFIFALLLSTTAAFAQDAAKLSDAEYTARKQALVQKYGLDYEKHAAEIYAPIAADKAAPAASNRPALASPPADEKTMPSGKVITKDDIRAIFGDKYEQFADFVGKPAAFLPAAKGQVVKWSRAEFKTTDDFTRQFIDNHKELIVIVD